jgi:hypothetical protein
MTKERVPRAKLLARLQYLVGAAKNAYEDDRNPMRYEKVVRPLEEAFDICLKLREQYRR